MKFIKKYILVSQCSIILLCVLPITSLFAQDARFTVVLDAGHGGHDPGAIGSFAREKDINLAITLDLGAIIEQRFKDVKVVYSRKTDKYLTLQERADVVNDHHADLFICVHTNSSPSASAYGAESFTLGLAKTKANLDVAMRENSVITLEDNYKSKYQGFDPNSVDSYIMFEFMQDKYIDRSVDFASIIQKQFHSYSNRLDRGVRQAGFWVLHRSACPSVLVEVGFISNPAEERYLSSDQGQKEMATAIFNAFVDYKRDHDKKSGRQSSAVSKIEPSNKVIETEPEDKPAVVTQEQPPVETKVATPQQTVPQTQPKISTQQRPVVNTKNVETDIQAKQIQTADSERRKNRVVVSTNQNLPVFKVQLLATTKKLIENSSEFKGVEGVDFFEEGGLRKYTVGSETDYQKIEKIRASVLSKFPTAFIIAFVGDKKLSPAEVMKLAK
ncbi:MAG: N-acetylmuramoyl-L-alanine amidase [Paludibacter sp.]|nr:N-acetylmuramoyl-L-alanine amidase [Paludibacter sp.]